MVPSGTARTSPSKRSEASILKKEGSAPAKAGNARSPSICSAKRHRQQVADGLLEPGEDKVRPMRRKPRTNSSNEACL